MDRDLIDGAAALAAGAAAYVAVAVYVWTRRRAAGGRALTLLLVAAGLWTTFNAIEVSLIDPAQQELWGDLKYVGIVLLPPALLAFALEYTGRRRRLRRHEVALLSIVPVVVLTLLFVPATHALVRDVPDDAPPGQYAVAEPGPVFWLNLVYSYVLIALAVLLLVLTLLTVRHRHARAWLLIGSCLFPLVLNAAYNLGLEAWFSIDPTPLGFSLAGLVLVWGFFRFRLFDLVPVGRRQVVEQIPDAVVVLDVRGRVADANPAAAAVIGLGVDVLIGHELAEVMSQLAPLLRTTSATERGAGSVLTYRADGTGLDLAVTISPLPDDQGPPTGRLVVMRDVTDQRDVERRLRELVSERTAIIETLQRGLYPVRLPQIPGLAVAAVLDPAEADTSIGGDFVDVRASGPGRWSLMVGDVVGKGAGAATLTALARHTTLALVALGWSPAAVLGEVSRAIAVDEDVAGSTADPRFCTLALATLEVAMTQTGAATADVVLSLGGHPRPLLVTARGEVTEVGVPGSLLGVLPAPELHDVPVRLGPGDCLVLFTDGVTEARRGGDAFGEARLAALLASLAGEPPDRLAAAVVTAVREFSEGETRDDVAVLVVRVSPSGDVLESVPQNLSEAV